MPHALPPVPQPAPPPEQAYAPLYAPSSQPAPPPQFVGGIYVPSYPAPQALAPPPPAHEVLGSAYAQQPSVVSTGIAAAPPPTVPCAPAGAVMQQTKAKPRPPPLPPPEPTRATPLRVPPPPALLQPGGQARRSLMDAGDIPGLPKQPRRDSDAFAQSSLPMLPASSTRHLSRRAPPPLRRRHRQNISADTHLRQL